MRAGHWCYARASVAGTSHTRLEQPCQDASDCRVIHTDDGDPVLVAVVSDGAGSARRAEAGSQLACGLLVDAARALVEAGGTVRDVTRAVATGWVERFQEEVRQQAAAEGLRSRDFACTALAAIVGVAGAAFLQIGDGAIVVSGDEQPDDFGCVFWPQRGEYENTTSFATDAAMPDRLDYAFTEGRVDEVALFTDGLQRLALHFQSRAAHAPFFRPMFACLRSAEVEACDRLSDALAAFLELPQVNARTDDDKTLILASRRTGDAPRAAAGDG